MNPLNFSHFVPWPFSTRVDTYRAPDNFLKQGVADVSLEAKGVFLQNAEVFSLPNFTQVRFYISCKSSLQ